MADDAPHTIIIYSKPGCHLCDIAYELVMGQSPAFSLNVSKIDITGDAQLWEQYHETIPVLVIDDHTVLTPPIRAFDIRRALEDQHV